MAIAHHLTDEILAAHAAGTLPEAFALVASSHISLCDACRARLEALEGVGGALLEEAGVESLDEGALEAVFARIEGAAPIPVRRAAGPLPAPVADYVGDLDGVRWRGLGNGVRQAILAGGRGRPTARLLHIPAGRAMPVHGHRGIEMTLVLQGAFSDEDGRYARGDVEIADAEVDHTPVAEAGEDCICLAATDAPLKLNGVVARLAQPFLRI